MQCLGGGCGANRRYFHPPVWQVPDPPVEAQRLARVLNEPPKADALDPT